jgi:hypothetical protein
MTFSLDRLLRSWKLRVCLTQLGIFFTVSKFRLSEQRGLKGLNNVSGTVVVYFSCKRHFYLLEKSLFSLLAISGDSVAKVVVFVDRTDFLDSTEEAKLLALSNRISIIAHGRVTGWGYRTLINQLQGFLIVVRKYGLFEWIVKMDSDTVIFKNKMLLNLGRLSCDFFGHPFNHVRFTHAYGACYAFRPRLLLKALSGSLFLNITSGMRLFSDERLKYPEDFAMSYLFLSVSGVKKEFEPYILNVDPDESVAEDSEVSILHYHVTPNKSSIHY